MARPMNEDKREKLKNKLNSLTLAFAKAASAHQDDKSDNLIVSPYNALTALSMVAKGAEGDTREELARALLGVSGKALDKEVSQLARLNAEILQANKGKVTLATANAIWTNSNAAPLKPAFAAAMKKGFGADISSHDFSDPSVPSVMNKWASDNTQGHIDKIVGELKPDDYAILASALFFKGDWTAKFEKELTQDKEFVSDGGEHSLTPMMLQYFGSKGVVRYQDGEDYEAVALTYGAEDRQKGVFPPMRLVLVRPTDETEAARDWLAKQSGSGADWLNERRFRPATGTVELPHIDVKQEHDLIPALKDLGLDLTFDIDSADFSRMSAEQLAVSKVTQNVVFKTDEDGSTAAAVTTVGMMRATAVMREDPPIHVKFDRSFVFALQDVETGTVLFVGAVNKPNEAMKPAGPKKRGQSLRR